MARSTSSRIARFTLVASLVAALSGGASSSAAEPLAGLDALYPSLDTLYQELHRTPELSLQEKRTAARMAGQLRELGFEVTEKVGGTGVVGVLKNGRGPTVLLRTEMDGLPVKEETGLAFASRATTKDASGVLVPVMHACGHDIHMTAWVGAATLLSRSKDRWRGTLVMIAQPAEERVLGARAMIADGLFKRFPRPDFAVAIHDTPLLAAGRVGHRPGFALANVDTVEVTIHGKGGHGAAPHQTVDPVVIAARTVMTLQTLVSREVNPIEPAVVTVGSIHGGTKSNIVPDEVKLQITVRSYKDEVQKQLLAGIARIARGEAAAAGAPRKPVVTVNEDSAHATWNDPALDARLVKVLERSLGKDKVAEVPPLMVAEDFSELSRAGIPAVLIWVGAADPTALQRATARGQELPGLHSSKFVPDRKRTIRTGVTVLTVSALELLGRP
jgi:hippurate hydrolase